MNCGVGVHGQKGGGNVHGDADEIMRVPKQNGRGL